MQPNLLAASVKSGQPKFKFAIDNITGPAGRNLALNINLNAQQKAATTNQSHSVRLWKILNFLTLVVFLNYLWILFLQICWEESA